jgi:hypothetical protein
MHTLIEVRPVQGRAAGLLRHLPDWVVTRNGEEVERFRLKVFAVICARRIGRDIEADGDDAELVIKNAAGRIVQKDSYGFDPYHEG